MSISSRRISAAVIGGFAVAAIAAGSVFAQGPAAGDALPEGPGKAALSQVCTQCHALTIVTARHRSPEEWADVVSRMESMGASMDAGQKQTILAYLSANLGTGAAAPAAGAEAPAAPAAATPPTEAPKH